MTVETGEHTSYFELIKGTPYLAYTYEQWIRESDCTIVLPCSIMILVITTSALSATTGWNHSTPTQARKWRLDGLMAAQWIYGAWQVVHLSWILYEDLKEDIYTMTLIRHMSCNNPSAYFNKVAECLHLLLIYLDVSQAYLIKVTY